MKAFFAIVYELCLDGEHVAKDDPLYETSYIGQAGRYSSSPEETLEMRWRGHQSDAKNHPKEQGIRWALKKYGPEAFSKRIICFLNFEKRCVEALDYMNAVEIEEIDCRGGVMKDISPTSALWQTFNLTNGGQGDAAQRFASLQAKEERAWKRFQEKVLELVQDTGTSRCTAKTSLKCGYGIGEILFKIRTTNHLLVGVENAAERKAWLEEIPGWSWTVLADMNEQSWEVFQKELLAHIEEFHTGYVRYAHVSASGYRLGAAVSKVRRSQQFLNGDEAKERIDWLNSLEGWTWNAKNSVESRRLQSAASHERVTDPVQEKPRLAKQLETMKRKREERWATLNEVELTEAKHQFEIEQKATAKRKAKRQAKARGEAPEPKEKKSPKPKTEVEIRSDLKVKADLAALKATLVPKAGRRQLSRFRKDGTVAKAHQILRERSVDAGV